VLSMLQEALGPACQIAGTLQTDTPTLPLLPVLGIDAERESRRLALPPKTVAEGLGTVRGNTEHEAGGLFVWVIDVALGGPKIREAKAFRTGKN